MALHNFQLIVKASLFALTLLSGMAHGVWYEASGTAPIIEDDVEKARQRATAEAIRNASLYAGTSISSQQSISSGILQDDSWSFQSNSQIRKTQVIAEKREGDEITITIRADIFAEPNCSQSQLSHNVTIARFPLAHRQQASYGGLYELGGATSKVLHGLFQEQSRAVNSHLWLDEVLNYQSDTLNPQPEVDELARTLAQRTNSQYVLLGQIRDISVRQKEPSAFDFFNSDPSLRALAIEVDLFDGISGERIKRFRYQDQAYWDFKPSRQLDPYSADFWQSGYGKAWGYLLGQVQQDVEASLACRPAIAHVVSQQESGLIVNLGSQDGVRVGHIAQLSHLGTFMDGFGRVKSTIQPSKVKLKVEAVKARQALLVPEDASHLAGIQDYDVVIFQGNKQL